MSRKITLDSRAEGSALYILRLVRFLLYVG